jgi:hypothetical protein
MNIYLVGYNGENALTFDEKSVYNKLWTSFSNIRNWISTYFDDVFINLNQIKQTIAIFS